jgi:NADH-quinone oxidoreductase subunit L
MAVSVIAAGFGFLIAWMMYVKKSLNPEKIAERMAGLYQVMINKYYVDEVYDKILVNPTKRLAEILWRAFDDKVVDGTVNGVANLVEWSGGIVRRIQTGYVASYAMLFVLGIIVVLGYMLMK